MSNPMTVKVKKSTLLTKLRANKEKHRDEYDKAMTNWRKEVAKEARKVVGEAEEGTFSGSSISKGRARGAPSHPLTTVLYEEPDTHLAEYTTVIGMLEMSEDETIVLGHGQFLCYVEDEWDWKKDWMFSNSKYL